MITKLFLLIKKTDERPRGILTEKEAKELFSLEWDNEAYKLANELASISAMKSAEVRALKVKIVQRGYLKVNVAWGKIEKDIKKTKTDKDHKVFDRYADHIDSEDMKEIEEGISKISGKILSFEADHEKKQLSGK